MALKTKTDLKRVSEKINDHAKFDKHIFSKDYVDFLSEAGWRLEKKFPSNRSNYSDLLEDTDWQNDQTNYKCSKHYRRDLDAIS